MLASWTAEYLPDSAVISLAPRDEYFDIWERQMSQMNKTFLGDLFGDNLQLLDRKDVIVVVVVW